MRSPKKRFAIRKQRVRTEIRKSTERPRLSVFKSGRHLYVQLIDDKQGLTLASASTLEQALRQKSKSHVNKAMAEKIGQMIGERASKAGVKQVVFDKGGYKYHGVVKALADSARAHLEF